MKQDEMSVIKCPKCQAEAGEVLNMEDRKRVGWYCETCKHFEIAILRETVLPPEKLNGKPREH